VQLKYPGFDIAPLLNLPDNIEIYSILSSTEPILINEAPPQFQMRGSLTSYGHDLSSKVDSPIPLGGSSRPYTFRYQDTDECRTLAIPDSSIVAYVCRLVSRDRRHSIVLFLDGTALPDPALFSAAVPLGSEVRVEIQKLRYTVKHEHSSVQIPLEDSATAIDLKGPVIQAFFPDRAISPDSLSFTLIRGNVEFPIKAAKEPNTRLIDFHAPDLVIIARLRNPPYYFQPPGDYSKPKKMRFPDNATIDYVYDHWEKQLKRPVLLRASNFMIPRASTSFSSLGLSGQTINVEFASELESAIVQIRLPGHKSTTVKLRPGDTARTLLSQLTYDNPEQTSVSFEGNGESVNIGQLRLAVRARDIEFEHPLWPLAGEPLEVILLSRNNYSFSIDAINFEERVPPEATIEEVEWRLSRVHAKQLELIDDDVFIHSKMQFKGLADALAQVGQNIVGLRKSLRTLFLFENSDGSRRFLRFGERTLVREAKMVLLPGARLCEIRLSQRGIELIDNSLLISANPTELIQWEYNQTETIQCVDEDGHEITVNLNDGIIGVEAQIGGNRPFQLKVLNSPISILKPYKRGPIKIEYLTNSYQFNDNGKIISRFLSPFCQFKDLSSQFRDNVSFAVNYSIKQPYETLGSVSRDAIIRVFRDTGHTIADFKREDPGKRWIFSDGETILPGSVSTALTSQLTKRPAERGAPRKFTIQIPFSPLRPSAQVGPRIFYFDFETTVADVHEIIADITRFTFPPYALFVEGNYLTDDEFLFDVATEQIEVRIKPRTKAELRIIQINQNDLFVLQPSTIFDLKSNLGAHYNRKPIEFICHGKALIDTESIQEAKLTHDSNIYIYVPPPEPEGYDDPPFIPTSFDFVFGHDHKVSLPYINPRRVAEVKRDLAHTLAKPVSDLSIIDGFQMLCLEENEDLAPLVRRGRSFTLTYVDRSVDLRDEQKRLIQKNMPGKSPDEGKLLFLQCAGNPNVFRKTCKKRGFI
jgi:hypothetical protein